MVDYQGTRVVEKLENGKVVVQDTIPQKGTAGNEGTADYSGSVGYKGNIE